MIAVSAWLLRAPKAELAALTAQVDPHFVFNSQHPGIEPGLLEKQASLLRTRFGEGTSVQLPQPAPHYCACGFAR